jgi:hypothetical protein
MKRIELWTRTGFVAVVEILPFLPGKHPEVVIWGERVFQCVTPERYCEAFCVVSLTPSPGFEREVPPEPPPVDRSAVMSLHGTPVEEVRKQQATQPTGQHPDYLVLSDEERGKGFVRPVRRSYKHLKCGVVTTMGVKLAETYAREPTFYGATFCTSCNTHLPVGEFEWEPSGGIVGS